MEGLQTNGTEYLQVHLDRLLEKAESLGFRVAVEQKEVDAEAVGIVGREHEYEGGFVLLTFFFADL